MNSELLWHKYLRRPYKLHTERYGDPSKPVIVFLHGIAASSENWNTLVPLLIDKYCCVTIDLLGFAESPKPQWAEYTMDEHVASIAYTIKKLRLPKRFVLVGHSLGSFLATRYTRQYQDRVHWLLLLSPPIYPPLREVTSKTARKRTDLLLRLYKFLRTHPRMTPENMRLLSYVVPLPRSITKFPETWLPFHRSLERCIEQQTITDDIRSIVPQTDIFYGTIDTVVVSANVLSLTNYKSVDIHSFHGNHSLNRTYAKTVAKVLLSGR